MRLHTDGESEREREREREAGLQINEAPVTLMGFRCIFYKSPDGNFCFLYIKTATVIVLL